MASNQEYESIEVEDVDDIEDEEDDDVDAEDKDMESPPPKNRHSPKSKPKKRPKKRRAPPDTGGCCQFFFCAFLLAIVILLGFIVGAYFILTQKGYHFSATHEDGHVVSDDLPWLHGWSRHKSLDPSGSTTTNAGSMGGSSSSSTARSKGRNHQDEPTMETPPKVSHSSGHIISSSTNSGDISVVSVGNGDTPVVEEQQLVTTSVPTEVGQPAVIPPMEEKPTSGDADDDALSNPNKFSPP